MANPWTVPRLSLGGFRSAVVAAGTMIVAACDPATELSFATVSAGLMHTCGITTAGRAYCWGDNFVGQLGDGTATLFQTRPVAVAGGLRFAAVSAGHVHSCGQTTAGAAYCWGDNTYGELGDGTTINPAIPIWSTTPVQVLGGLGFAAVSAGGVVDNTGPHSCGVTTAGKAYCWGNNAYAELGDGTTIPRASPVPVTGGLSFAALSVGGAHNCGITTAGVTYCWGDNTTGQLGDGTTTSRATPVPVIGGRGFAMVSAGMRVASQTHAGGSAHTCGLTTEGTAYCWGDNTAGELGDGTTIPRTNPVTVAGGLSFAAVSVGGNHNCGITTASTAYCWGDNTAGQLGDGTTLGRTYPVPVNGGLKFAVVTAGFDHTCGVTTAGGAYCWGDNFRGELGDDSNEQSNVPVKVAGAR